MSIPPEELSPKRARALADTRRVALLSVLSTCSAPVSLYDLAAQVAREETTNMVTEAHIDTVRVSLYHHHLPKLQELDLIEYDWDGKTLTSLTVTDEVFASKAGEKPHPTVATNE